MKKQFTAASILGTFCAPLVSFAQIINPLGSVSIPQIIATILSYIAQVGGVFAVIMFIWVGFKFVTAQGNTTKLQEARKMFFWTVIGVAILLGAQLLATIIVGTIKTL